MACYDSLLGAVSISPLSYAPNYFAFCNGSLMSISQNCALFSLLGTNYGGNGVVTYGLPDFRGRNPVGAYPYSYTPAPDALDYTLGIIGGDDAVSPQAVDVVAHDDKADPKGDAKVLCLKPDQIQTLPPYLALNFIIAVSGVFPYRD